MNILIKRKKKMMKLNRLGISLILVGILLSLNSVYAVVDTPATKDSTQTEKSFFKEHFGKIIQKTDKKMDAKVDTKKTTEQQKQVQIAQTAYTNDVHSVFTLADCVEIAIKYNPVIQSSVYNAQMYKSKIGQAWANYFPSLGVGIQGQIGDTRTSSDASYGGSGMNVQNTLGYLPQLSANMLLFDFGKTKATADSAKRTFESKELDTTENINVLIYDIKEAYFNILFAQKQVNVYKDTVADYELQLKRAKSFYETGKKAKIDVITAEYNLGKAQLNLVKAENVLEVANAQLSKIMGIPEYTNYELGNELSTLKYDITQDDAIQQAYSVRPELISAQKKAEAAKLNLRAKKRDYAPNLGLFASYDNGLGTEYNISSYKVGVGLNYSSFNIAKVKKQIDEATFAYEKSMADLEIVKHELFLSVKKTCLDLTTAEEAIIIAKLALDEAKEQYRQVSGRYKAGVGDYIELKDGETTYLNARLDFYNALLNYNVTAAKLEKEIGMPIEPSKENLLKNFVDKTY